MSLEKTCLCHMRTMAQMRLHFCAVLSAPFIHCLDSITPIVAILVIPRLDTVANQAGLCLAWSQTFKDRFSHDMAHIFFCVVIQ